MKNIARIAFAATGLAALLAISAAASQANASPRHSHINRVTYKVKIKRGKPRAPRILSASGNTPAQSSGCGPPLILFSRAFLCLVLPVTVTVIQLEDGEPVNDEAFAFAVQTEVSLSSTSTTFHLGVEAVGLKTTGDDPALVPSITISSECLHPCQRTTPQLLALGTPHLASGGGSNEVITHLNQLAWPKPVIELFADFGGTKSSTASWPIVPVIRCDHLYPKEWRKPGCVFPAFIPTVDMSGLSHIAKNIRTVQGRGIHVGQPGGRNPLHRASDAQQIKNNRNQVCPKHKKRPPGDQCDEYPFASAWEGGKKLPAIDRIADWVPKEENQRQGVILSRFYSQNRIKRGSPGDAFYVRA